MVSTDMGHTAAKGFGSSVEELGAITPSESAKSVLEVIDAAKKDTHGGKFWSYTGEEFKW
jgi:norsolorinic acid ketoreductase